MADSPRPTRQWPGPPIRGAASAAAEPGTVPSDATASDGGADPAAPDAGDTSVGSPTAGADHTGKPGPPAGPATVDEAVEAADEQVQADLGDLGDLAGIAAERDEYLDRLKRLQADFENYKKRVAKQQIEHRERAAEDLLTQLLPVLDNFDLALAHGADGLGPVHRSLLEVLDAAGLERLDPLGQPFDPNEHDAVLHEAADDAGGDDDDAEVIEVLRAGYRWKGRVLRAAMVKVKG